MYVTVAYCKLSKLYRIEGELTMPFNRTAQVIQNRNKAEKKRKKLREDEMQILNSQTAFKARLADDLKDIDFILSDPKISSVIVQVPEDKIAEFARSIHTEDLADYDVQQYENQADMFKISKKLITF